MSWTTNKLIAIVLPLIIFAAILTGLQSIKTTSLDPAEQELGTTLDAVGTTTVELGKYKEGNSYYQDGGTVEYGELNKREAAEEELRALVIFNMMRSQNCLLLNHFNKDMRHSDNQGSYVLGLRNGNGKKAAFTSFGKFETPLAIGNILSNNLDYTPVCVGTTNLKKLANPTQIEVVSLTGDKAEKPGNDMEGRFGKMRFKNSRTFVIENPYLLGYRANTEGDMGGLNLPGFWLGKRISGFIPPGIYPSDGFGVNEGYKIHPDESEPGSGGMTSPKKGNNIQSFQAFRVRMKNVPKIISDDSWRNKEDYKDDNHEVRFRDMLQSIDYVVCSGAKGSVQSNAKDKNNGGEATGDTPRKEDAVFPEISIENNDCIQAPNKETFTASNIMDIKDKNHDNFDTATTISGENCEPSSYEIKEDKVYLTPKKYRLGFTLGIGNNQKIDIECGYLKETIKMDEIGFGDDYEGKIQNIYRPGLLVSECPKPESYELTTEYVAGGEDWANPVFDNENNIFLTTENVNNRNERLTYNIAPFDASESGFSAEVDIKVDKPTTFRIRMHGDKSISPSIAANIEDEAFLTMNRFTVSPPNGDQEIIRNNLKFHFPGNQNPKTVSNFDWTESSRNRYRLKYSISGNTIRWGLHPYYTGKRGGGFSIEPLYSGSGSLNGFEPKRMSLIVKGGENDKVKGKIKINKVEVNGVPEGCG